VIRVEVATVLVAWAAGGWFFLWVTTRRREAGLGYGWLLRSLYSALAAGSLAAAAAADQLVWRRDAFTVLFVVLGSVALAVSVIRRHAGVAGPRKAKQRRSARVAAMTGGVRPDPRANTEDADRAAAEFPPVLDLLAASAGLAACALGASAAGGPAALAVVRITVGALFLGAVTDAMLLGHWYLVQPGLRRGPLLQLLAAACVLWLPETAMMLWPVGMVSVLNGTIDDGYNGLLGWFWVACTITTLGLVAAARAALRERGYSAVMAATGLMYLAIVTAFGQDLVARMLLAG